MAAIVKLVTGLALASLKTFNGLAAASLKSINGQDSTTGAPTGMLFEWHCETTDVTTGTPAGSSVGDKTATANGAVSISPLQFQDGANSILVAGASQYYIFDWASGTPIVDPLAGTIDFYVRFTTIADQALIYLEVDGSNRIVVSVDSGNSYINTLHQAGGTSSNARTNVGAITTGTWYHVKVRWDHTAHSGLYVKTTCDTTTGEGNSADNGTNALGTFAGSSGFLNIGDRVGYSGVYHIDNIKIYSSWQ